ncbi:phospholipid scramblase family member 5-like [Bufo bufo]|uniref:phospholipid scramblase family member 5-like n=1 Tax=Bufo bufo TaxID=8384 RepID=UPI001ABD9E67|nr:phospholipid scramblase family member 5-like [Bufo bufo]
MEGRTEGVQHSRSASIVGAFPRRVMSACGIDQRAPLEGEVVHAASAAAGACRSRTGAHSRREEGGDERGSREAGEVRSRARRSATAGLGCHSKRLYIISSRTAKQLLVAIEESSCLCYQLCGPARSCCLRLYDQNREEVLRLCRPYRVDVCCLFCCLMVIRVFSKSNALLGFVQQRWSLFSLSLSVHDSDGKRTMEIQGPWSAARCHSDQEFQVTSVDGQKIAIIWKRWPGFNEDYNMDHDFFGLDILASISPTDKALLLSATFLLNYMFFEMS